MSEFEMSPSEQDMAYDALQDAERKERIEQFGFDVTDTSLWKSYVCHKNVLAVPMKRGIYNKYQGWLISENENPEDDGYLVEYVGTPGAPNHHDHDFYISWSPKAVFEQGYEEIKPSTPKERVQVEAKGVDLLIFNLGQLLGKPQPTFISNTQWYLLKLQFDYMNGYSNILAMRLKYWDVECSQSDLDKFQRSIAIVGGKPPRGLVANMAYIDEAPFYQPGAEVKRFSFAESVNISGLDALYDPSFVRIHTMKPLENSMALGTVEVLSAANGQLDFSDALRALKFGYRVQRSGWNGKDMWLSVSNLNTAIVSADKFWSPHNSEYAKNNGGSAEVPPCITMKNARGQIQMGWAPSPEDMFASDWYVFEKEDVSFSTHVGEADVSETLKSFNAEK